MNIYCTNCQQFSITTILLSGSNPLVTFKYPEKHKDICRYYHHYYYCCCCWCYYYYYYHHHHYYNYYYYYYYCHYPRF